MRVRGEVLPNPSCPSTDPTTHRNTNHLFDKTIEIQQGHWTLMGHRISPSNKGIPVSSLQKHGQKISSHVGTEEFEFNARTMGSE